LGRSLINTVSAARTIGLWDHNETLVDSAHLGYLPAHSLLLVATGSQGEPRTALYRLSMESFRDLSLGPGDTVIFSARAIPGNEQAIETLISRLKAMQIIVITPETSDIPIHASGHPAEEELAALYDWIKPRTLVPVHGEQEHMQAQTKLAKSCAIEKQLCGQNGDLFTLAPAPSIRRALVNATRLGVNAKGLKEVAQSQPK